MIISDNASTDGTEQICKEYAARDDRIRYTRQTYNLGAHGNFNYTLHAARGEYFMWAAIDDLWALTFISALLERLEKDRTAIGAFCPYQLVEEETGATCDGIWRCSYEDRSSFMRCSSSPGIIVTHAYTDLIGRALTDGIEFRPWGGINADTPYNNAYPLIYFLLSRGNFLVVGNIPLWYKNVRGSHWHSTPFTVNPLLGYFAHIIR